MSIDRREFLKTSAALAALRTLPAHTSLAAYGEPASSPVQATRMAWAAATWYRPYTSKPAHARGTTMWLQMDLGAERIIDAIRIYPAFTPGDEHANGYGFPVRFRIEAADEPSFASPRLLVDRSQEQQPEPYDHISEYAAGGVAARYVRLTATELRAAHDGVGYTLALSKMDVVSGGKDVAERCAVTGDAEYGNANDYAQLTRPARPMGEGIVTDNQGNVIPATQWRAVPNVAAAPLGGVSVQGELFKRAMENNIGYLLGSFSVDEMLRPFRERAGKPVRPGLRKPINFWDTATARIKRWTVPDGRRQHPALDGERGLARRTQCNCRRH